MAAEPAAASKSPTARLRNFERWMRDVGIKWDASLVRFECSMTGFSGLAMGVVAVSEVADGTELCMIPKSALLSIRNTEISHILQSENLGGGLGLTIAVLHELSLGRRSRWHGYLAALPEREYLPIFWADEELDLLEGTELQETPITDRRLTQEDFKTEVEPLVDKYPRELKRRFWTLDNFQRAASLVASRAFRVDNYHGDAMVPLADVFNHKASVVELAPGYVVEGMEDADDDMESCSDADGACESGSEHDSADGGQAGGGGGGDTETEHAVLMASSSAEPSGRTRASLQSLEPCLPHRQRHLNLRLEMAICSSDEPVPALQIVAASNVPKGQEVHNTYGEHSNKELLNKYGFCLRHNPFDVVVLDKAELLACADATIGKRSCRHRCRFLKMSTMLVDEDEEPFEVYSGGRVGPSLFALLAVLSVPQERFLSWDGTDRMETWVQERVACNEAAAGGASAGRLSIRAAIAAGTWSEAAAHALAAAVQRRLAQYRSGPSMEEDLAQLSQAVPGPPSRASAAAAQEAAKRHAVRQSALLLRIGERELLHDAQRDLEEGLRQAGFDV